MFVRGKREGKGEEEKVIFLSFSSSFSLGSMPRKRRKKEEGWKLPMASPEERETERKIFIFLSEHRRG